MDDQRHVERHDGNGDHEWDECQHSERHHSDAYQCERDLDQHLRYQHVNVYHGDWHPDAQHHEPDECQCNHHVCHRHKRDLSEHLCLRHDHVCHRDK
mmetsp:Transcript_100471/g.284443  ORF Transcript_100471/g.284443 Transcript_100471/m.284443 type:complete len:97 (-) Transcript_100471:438-728(-)